MGGKLSVPIKPCDSHACRPVPYSFSYKFMPSTEKNNPAPYSKNEEDEETNNRATNKPIMTTCTDAEVSYYKIKATSQCKIAEDNL